MSTGGAVSTADTWLIRLLWFHAGLSLLWIVLAWRDAIVEHADLRFVVNTTGKDGLFAIMSVVAAVGDRGRRLGIVLLLLGAYGCLMVGQLFELLFADPSKVMTWPADTEATTYLLLWLGGDIVLVVAFALLYRAVKRAR
jgi:hypothetical protein